MKKQYEEMEEQINNLKANKYGRKTNVFKMREKLLVARRLLRNLVQGRMYRHMSL